MVKSLGFMGGAALAALALAGPGSAALDPTAGNLRALPDLAVSPPDGQFVRGIRSVGDVTGDGLTDLVVATADERPRPIGDIFVRGTYWLLPGSTIGGVRSFDDPATGVIRLRDTSSGSFGRPVAMGDVNEDGFDDIGFQTFGQETGATDAVILFGGPSIGPITDVRQADPGRYVRILDEGFDNFSTVSRGGDVDGDGVADIVIGRTVREGATGRSDETWRVVPGGADLSDIQVPTPPLGTRKIAASASVSVFGPPTTGDFNGDGRSDLTWMSSRGGTGPSAQIVFGGSAEDAVLGSSSVRQIPRPNVIPSEFSLVAYDPDGDGVDDLLTYGQAAATLFPGGPDIGSREISVGPTVAADNGFVPSGASSTSYGPAGDVDGDGREDLLFSSVMENCMTHDNASISGALLRGQVPASTRLAQSPAIIFEGADQFLDERSDALPEAGDFNGDGVGDLAVGGLPFTASGRACATRENLVKITYGVRPPTCSGPAIPTGDRLLELVRGASLRRTRQSGVKLSVIQLRANQRIAADAIRRLNAIRDWLDGGIEGRDICGDALGAEAFAEGTETGSGPVAAEAAPNPRPLVVDDRPDDVEKLTLTRQQLVINQRISQAAIARANALAARMSALTGGDVVDASVSARALRSGLTVEAGEAENPPPSATEIVPPNQAGADGVSLTAQQLEINNRIAREVRMRAERLQERIRSGLIEENFSPGSLTAADIAP